MARLGARVFLAATSLRRGKETTRQPMAWPRNFQLESIAETQPQLQPALLRLSEPPCELCSKGAGPRFTNTFGIGLRSYMQLSGARFKVFDHVIRRLNALWVGLKRVERPTFAGTRPSAIALLPSGSIHRTRMVICDSPEMLGSCQLARSLWRPVVQSHKSESGGGHFPVRFLASFRPLMADPT